MNATAASTMRNSSWVQCAVVDRYVSTGIPEAPHLSVLTPSSPTHSIPLRTVLRPRERAHNNFALCSSRSTSSDSSPPERIAVLLEVDGVLMDPYQSGNRKAFNVAFRKLGLDCANWTEPIYSDLLRRADGNEERMLALYFNRIGWPTSLPTNEKDSFMKSVIEEKKNALADFLTSKDTPLRWGVEQFIDDACNEGMCVVILTTCSKIGEETARAIVEKLGCERTSKLKVVGKKEVENSFYRQLESGFVKFLGPKEELANEANKAVAAERKRIAEGVASMLNLSVDTNTTTAESVGEIVAALRAGAEIVDVPVSNSVLVAGSQLAVAAAQIIGMPCIFLRSRLTSRVELPSTVSSMEGFGNVYLTVSKLRSKLSSSSR